MNRSIGQAPRDVGVSLFVRSTILFASSLTVMAGAVVSPALPQIAAFYSNHTLFEIRLVLTAPALTIALGAPLAGYLADRYGRLPLLLGALGLYIVSGTSGLWLERLEAILIGRLFLGLAVAGVTTAAISLVGDLFTGRERARFLGQQSAFMALGGVGFLLAGGFLADISFRLPFVVYLAAALALPGSFALRRLIQRKRRESEFAATAPLQALQARFPPFLFLLYAILLCGMMMFYMIPLQLPFLLEEVFGFGGKGSGAAIALSTLCGSLSSILYSRIRERLPFALIFSIQFALMSSGFLLLALTTTSFAARLAIPPLLLLAAALLLSGAGTGLLLPNTNSWLLSLTPERFRGRASGGVATSFSLGMFLSPFLATTLSQPLFTAALLEQSMGLSGSIFLQSSLLLAALSFLALLLWRSRFGEVKKSWS